MTTSPTPSTRSSTNGWQVQRVEVDVPAHRYQVVIGAGALERLGALLHECCPGTRRAFVVADRAVAEGVGRQVMATLAEAGAAPIVAEVEASEASKTVAGAERLWQSMLDARLDRTAIVVALGGGVVGDLAGFVAATFMRGVDCVQVPTTLLAMVDASIGGKSAVNLPCAGGLAKNAVGVFRQPRRVICDPLVLATLPDRVLSAGLAECLKHAMISDPELATWMEAQQERIFARDAETLTALIARSAKVKAGIVARDEHEAGERTLLNLGHTFAHALEGALHESISHGEAVGLGLLAATEASRASAHWPGADPDRVERRLRALHLPTRAPTGCSLSVMLDLMGMDKKHRAGRWRLVLPVGEGACRVVDDPPREAVVAGWRRIGVT
ncbi:MAG: 3-dehydroquinate synthase [Phycisphaeraceae bacterium]|nr:3-dehydroquinate synthase [Phycisphaeraceae bacterium]